MDESAEFPPDEESSPAPVGPKAAFPILTPPIVVPSPGPAPQPRRAQQESAKAPVVQAFSHETGPPLRPTSQDIRTFANELNRIEREVNEWGHASMSGLVLFPMSDRFHINNQEDIGTYRQEVKDHVAGSASLSRDIGLVAAAALGVNAKDLTAEADDIPSATGLGGIKIQVNGDTLMQGPDPGDIASEDEEAEAEDGGGSPGEASITQEFAPHVEFGSSPTLSPDTVDAIAGSAFVNKEVMNLFSFPAGASDQFVMFFGIAQVNVSPGWRTQEDYYCEVQMRPIYARQEGDKYLASYEYGVLEQPMVFSAFPLVKAQVLDLKSHEQRQADLMMSFAAAAAAAGNHRSARFLLNYHKKLTQDVQTRSALPLLVPSSDGSQLSYRFEPGLQAIEDPSSLRSRPENVLNPTSVPTLFVVVCEREELSRWTHINILVNTRFAPVDRRHLLAQAVYDLPRFSFVKGIRRDNHQRLQSAQSYTRLNDFVNHLNYYNYEDTPLTQEMMNRFLHLRTLAGGLNLFTELPVPETFIHIEGVYPSSVPASQSAGTQLYVKGNFGAQGGQPTVLVAGKPVPIQNYGKNGILLAPLGKAFPAGSVHPVVVSNAEGLHVFPEGLEVTADN